MPINIWFGSARLDTSTETRGKSFFRIQYQVKDPAVCLFVLDILIGVMLIGFEMLMDEVGRRMKRQGREKLDRQTRPYLASLVPLLLSALGLHL